LLRTKEDDVSWTSHILTDDQAAMEAPAVEAALTNRRLGYTVLRVQLYAATPGIAWVAANDRAGKRTILLVRFHIHDRWDGLREIVYNAIEWGFLTEDERAGCPVAVRERIEEAKE
jgi:hypothetical protein